MEVLKRSGLIEVISEGFFLHGKPLLAICVGLQLLATFSYEHGKNAGLGWLDTEVLPFHENFPEDSDLRIPHTGWNLIHYSKPSVIFDGINDGSSFYFNHSFFMRCDGIEDFIVARCTYGVEFTAAVQKDNLFGCQFHPEKSKTNGLRLLKNFTEWCP
jgi:glutamine amidotransferase